MTSLTLYGHVRVCRIIGRITAGFILDYYTTCPYSMFCLFSTVSFHVLPRTGHVNMRCRVPKLDSSLGRAEAAKHESNAVQ